MLKCHCVDNNIWNRPFLNCLAELCDAMFLHNLILNLYVHECLLDFMLLLKQIAEGSLSPTNITFLLCLERKWQSLTTTTQIRFRLVTKKFWLVKYQLLKGEGIRGFFVACHFIKQHSEAWIQLK